MIITQEKSTSVISNIIATPSRFKIKASAKAFKILSGFYSEPILAIPRELGANAWDSHVKAKNTDKMFEVHAPNTLEPWFSIRDFGTGLTPEAIDTIYTTYFESTKTGDNDSDGCMGLGSKTPFNYTDNFNVTSFHKGKKHVYNCFIDESGSPSILHVVTQDSTEHNGVEIKFGVKISDIGMWQDKIVRAYEPFRYRPTIVGAKIEYKPREYIYTGKRWSMRRNDNGYYTRGCNAFMGNYCYPISTSALRNALYNIPNNKTHTLEQALNYGNFDFFFDIGELEVAPNKEQLQYEDNNATTLAIISAIQTAVDELKEMVYKSIETPKSRWEAMYLYDKYNGYNSQYSHLRNIIGDIPIKYNDTSVNCGNENLANVHKNSGCLSTNAVLDYYRLYFLESLNGKIKSTGTYNPYSDTREVRIFYTNTTSIKKSRLRHYLNTTYTAGKVPPKCLIIVDASTKAETFFKHAKYFGWDSSIITNVDTLPKAPIAPRQKKTVGTDEIIQANIGDFFNTSKNLGGRALSVYWYKKAASFDSSGTYYYVDFYYNDPVYGPDNKNISDVLSDAVSVITKDKTLTENIIYGINVKNKSMRDIGNWINVMDLVKKNIDSNKAKYEQEMYKISQGVHFSKVSHIHSKLSASPSIISNLKNDDSRNMFKTFIKTYTGVHSNPTVNSKLLDMFKVNAVKHEDLDIDPIEFTKTIETKYFNLFQLIDPYQNNPKIISNLINFIDEKS